MGVIHIQKKLSLMMYSTSLRAWGASRTVQTLRVDGVSLGDASFRLICHTQQSIINSSQQAVYCLSGLITTVSFLQITFACNFSRLCRLLASNRIFRSFECPRQFFSGCQTVQYCAA